MEKVMNTTSKTINLIKKLSGLTVANAKDHLKRYFIENEVVSEQLRKSNDEDIAMFSSDLVDGDALHPHDKNQQLIKRWVDSIASRYVIHDDDSISIYFKKEVHEFFMVEENNGLFKEDGECFFRVTATFSIPLHESGVVRRAFDSFIVSKNIRRIERSAAAHQAIAMLVGNMTGSVQKAKKIQTLLESFAVDKIVFSSTGMESHLLVSSKKSMLDELQALYN